jgi:Type II CAAX prenyl endopeptidase Rce1-like
MSPSNSESQRLRPIGAGGAVVTTGEVLAVYAAILLYIWRWQDTHPYLWIPLLAAVLFSQWVYHDTPKEMGLTGHEFRPCARLSLPVLAAVVVPAVVYALWNHSSAARLESPRVWPSLGAYLVWCSFQQYLTQSYFHRRLMKVLRTPHLSSLVIAIMFAGAHIPNPVLMVATFAGGFVFAEIFIRHPNIWPLAFVQAVAGFLIGTLLPSWIIHSMRVGPGYFFFHLR